jgi:hypothetical protein
MKLADIKNKNTLRCIQNLNIDVEPFATIDELRTYIKMNRTQLYQQKNADYFRTYMRQKYAVDRVKEGKPYKPYKKTLLLTAQVVEP